MYVTGVAKKYICTTTTVHRKGAKKYWHLYFYTEDGKFHAKRISFWQAMYYKTQKKVPLIKRKCPECGKKYMCIGLAFCHDCQREI